jgi:hypothetical protein
MRGCVIPDVLWSLPFFAVVKAVALSYAKVKQPRDQPVLWFLGDVSETSDPSDLFGQWYEIARLN